jgi:hypothetical protein
MNKTDIIVDTKYVELKEKLSYLLHVDDLKMIGKREEELIDEIKIVKKTISTDIV